MVEGRNAAAAQGDNISSTSELHLEHWGANNIELLSAPSVAPLKNIIPDCLLPLSSIQDALYRFLKVIDQHGGGEEVVEDRKSVV